MVLRGLPGGDSTAKPLDRERGKRDVADLRGLTGEQMARRAQQRKARTGRPRASAGRPTRPLGSGRQQPVVAPAFGSAGRAAQEGPPAGGEPARPLSRRNLATTPSVFWPTAPAAPRARG